MRFKSSRVGGVQLFAVTGVNTISFAIDATATARKGLLGFTVERYDPAEDERYVMPGYKVFRSLVPQPVPGQQVSTHDHPIQSFLWDDFTAKPGRRYEYTFRPMRGRPKAPNRTAPPVTIAVRTEPLYTTDDHDVFFNRGVASSQAYVRRFGNRAPDDLAPAQRTAALRWLTRDLEAAMIRFIERAGPSDTLWCAFYEFRHPPVVAALAAAAQRVAELRIILDAKDNGRTAADGTVEEAFPREANRRAILAAGIPASCIIERDANRSDIQHNKFMVLLKGAARRPTAVWTGSTNVSTGGLAGQTNVGHWVRDTSVAEAFAAYWSLLATNPGSAVGDDATTARRKKKAFRDATMALSPALATKADIPAGTTAIFSPRSGDAVLDLYVSLVDQAAAFAGITLAFGVNARFKAQLADNTPQHHLVFLLLEQRDKPRANATTAFVVINHTQNVYKAWGAYIKDPVYQWAKETNARGLRLNSHVAYIHSKFLLHDPLGADPIVVTGSANFSDASTTDNDENMIVVRGNRRVADIYFTEFNRLFNHYYFRSVQESMAGTPGDDPASELFLRERSTGWLPKYAPGTLRTKRLALYTKMLGFSTA